MTAVPNEDITRPHYKRAVGECGVYLDVYEATPADRASLGSIHFYVMDMAERLQAQWKDTPMRELKGEFEKNGLLGDVIFERFEKALVISVGFDSLTGVDNLWTAHETRQLQPIIQRVLLTPEVLQAVGAKQIELRARLWRDEYDACREEVQATEYPLTAEQKEADKAMIELAHHGQKTLTKKLLSLRDDFTAFDRQLGELTVILKTHLPHEVKKISTYNELKDHMSRIDGEHPRAINRKPFAAYNHVRDSLCHLVTEIETNIWHPLVQVHARSETNRQRQLKRQLVDACAKLARWLDDEYDFSQLKHPVASKRVLRLEHQRFLGLASVVFSGVDMIIDIDQFADDYMTVSDA